MVQRNKITVRVVYEGWVAKIVLHNSELEKIEKYYEAAFEEGANVYQIEERKKATSTMNSIHDDPDRLQKLAEDFVDLYDKGVLEGSTVKGKVLFVCSSREVGYTFYKNVVAYLGEKSSSSFSNNYADSFTKSFGSPEEWHFGNLPHRNKEGLIQFITFRLEDSLPQKVVEKLVLQLKTLPEGERKSKLREKCEKYLDNGYGCCALNYLEIAQVVFDALKYHDGKKYNLLSWSIMPNHVHVLIQTKDDLPKIIQSWKSFTGKWALQNNEKYNLGIPVNATKFWMADYWDRFIRDEAHFNNTVNYILNNPSKARLPKESMAYRFTGCIFSKRAKQELHPAQIKKVNEALHPTQIKKVNEALHPTQIKKVNEALHPTQIKRLDEELHPTKIKGLDEELHPTQIKMIMTRDKDDSKEMCDLLGTKENSKALGRQFKSEESNLKVAIIVDMWLT